MKTRNYNWYTMYGVEGIIVDEANPKFAGKKHIAQCGDYVFIPLSELEGIEIDEDDALLEYYDSYEPKEQVNIGEEIVVDKVVNIENKQCLFETFVNMDLYLDDLYTREICTLTDDHYQWTSELTKFVDRCVDKIDKCYFNKEAARKEWGIIEGKYHDFNQFNEEMTFGKVIGIIDQYR